MTLFTATPDPSTGSVRLSISPTAPVSRVQRTDANGTYDVRTLPGVLPYTSPQVEQRRNSATNPLPGNSTGWGTSAGYVKSYEANRAGRPAMVFTKSGGGYWITYGRRAGTATPHTGTLPGGTDDVVPVTPGALVRVFMDLGTDQPNADGRIILRFFNASLASIASTESPVSILGQNTWQEFTVSAVAPAGAAFYWVEFGIAMGPGSSGSTVGGEKGYAGRVLLGDGDDAPYFDGTTPSDATGDYSWTGTPHASASILSGPSEPLTLDDYEASHGSASYTVTTSAGEVSLASSWDLGEPWIGVPVNPQFSARVESITGYGAGVESRSTLVEPEYGPSILISRGGTSRRGTLECWAGSYAAALAMLRLAQRGQVMMLRQSENPGMDMFFTATAAELVTLLIAPDKPTVFGVKFNYTEVGRPTGPLSGALGWTWAELLNTYPTWEAVFNAYASWGDLQINREVNS